MNALLALQTEAYLGRLAGAVVATIASGADAVLDAFGVDGSDRRIFLDIFAARVRSGQTGTAWQRAALARADGDFAAMMSLYCERQRSGAPVHEWSY